MPGYPEVKSAMQPHGRRQRRMLMLALLLLAASVVLSLFAGRYSVDAATLLRVLKDMFTARAADSEAVVVLLRIRRMIAALVIGASLAVSGAVYQTVFGNPLASQDVLGVSAGACVGAAAAILIGLDHAGILLFAFVCGLCAVALTCLISPLFKGTGRISMVLAGVIVGGLMRSALGLLKFIADKETQLADMTYWELGSISRVSGHDLTVIAPILLVLLLISFLFRRRLDVFTLGVEQARMLGVHPVLEQGAFITVATLLTACAVAMCGSIGWVGLVIPMLSRLLCSGSPGSSIPCTALLSGSFLLLCDTAARSISSAEIPIAVITGAAGIPLFIIILLLRRKYS